MNLLKDGLEQNFVVRNNTNKKLVIDNMIKSFPIYRIKLDKLYYNDQNDRIATWIALYMDEHNIDQLDLAKIKLYNDIIHDFITESNKETIRKTQMIIKMVGQQECGVVLSDGRIIDGNRRFTCLRNIEKETGKTQYFDAVILDQSIENNAKQIKMLELTLQHGVDEIVGYNAIERLVGVYTNIIENKLLTLCEYADCVNQSESEILIEVEKAKLMVEFLEFINAPMQFHLARHFNLADPMKELNMMLKKIKDEEKKEALKNVVFAQYLMMTFGDLTRYARKIIKIASSSRYLDEYLIDLMENVQDVCKELKKYPKVTIKEINIMRANVKIRSDFLRSTEKVVNQIYNDTTRNHPTRNQPVIQTEKAIDSLNQIDTNIFNKLSQTQKDEIRIKLTSIDKLVLALRSEMDD